MKMQQFWTDETRRIRKTYGDFARDLNNLKSVNELVMNRNPYAVFLQIVGALTHNIDIAILDADLSELELRKIGVSSKDLAQIKSVRHRKGIERVEDIRSLIKKNRGSWKLTLFTSGTTGRPKRISHDFDGLSKGVKVGIEYRNNVWAFAYNPTHFAGIQVFLQAFMNGNSMIYIFETERKKIPSVIRKHGITSISATPTFYRSVVPFVKSPLPSVRTVTMGGERFDNNLVETFGRIFPNANVRNVYASSEGGSLFASESDVFELSGRIRPFVRVSSKGELWIHEDIVGDSDDLVLEDGWYNSGDIVERIGPNRIRFVSRKEDFINVGGYKVNPNEIECEILKNKGVLDAKVRGRKNPITGYIVVAEVVKNPNTDANQLEEKILRDLRKSLQPWKLPRIIKFVDSFELTRTGKKVRK